MDKRHIRPVLIGLLTCMVCVFTQLAFAGRRPEWKPTDLVPKEYPQIENGIPDEISPDSAGVSVSRFEEMDSVDSFFVGKERSVGKSEVDSRENIDSRGWGARQWTILALILGVLLGSGWLGYRSTESPVESAPPSSKGRKKRRAKRNKRTPNRNSRLSDKLEMLIGVSILTVSFAIGLMLGSLILGTVFVGFGYAVIGIGLPALLMGLGVLLLIKSAIDRWESNLRQRSHSHAGRIAIGCGIGIAGLALLVMIVGIVALALLLGSFMTWLLLAWLIGGVGYGMGLLIIFLMGLCIAGGWMIANLFFSGEI